MSSSPEVDSDEDKEEDDEGERDEARCSSFNVPPPSLIVIRNPPFLSLICLDDKGCEFVKKQLLEVDTNSDCLD